MDEVDLHKIPPRIRLLAIEKRLKRVRSLRTLRSRVCEYLHCGGSDVREFHHKINNHDWKGIIYLKRNNLMGSIFSLFDNKVLIIRGFPKIKYAHNSKVKDKRCLAEEKIDGTNIGIWTFPSGDIMGKTRMVQRWDLGSKRAGKEGSWKAKFESIPAHKRVYDLAKEGYLIFTELYGYENPGEFVKYSVPLAFKVIGIVDRKHQNFLPREQVEKLSRKYDLPLPEVYYKGELTKDKIVKIEADLEEVMTLDGMEGLVAKYWDVKDKDTYFCKLKTEKIKEKCYKLSRSVIPASIIRKAIRKTFEENPGETSMEHLLPFILEELKEEYDEGFIEKSLGKIKALLRYAVTPSDKDLKDLILNLMTEMKKEFDVTLPENKSKVLSTLADKVGDINAGTLYKIYLEILLEMKDTSKGNP